MRILVTGASGFIGGHLVRALAERGHEVMACVRRPEAFHYRSPEVPAIKGDFATDHGVSDWIPRLGQVDVVINAVGIIRQSGAQTFDALHTKAPIALFQACESAGVKRVIQISALGANESAYSHYHQSKYSADRYLRQRHLDWAVVMPSIVYGPGARSMALFKAIAALPIIPLIDAGDQQIQPIHISDLTRVIVHLVESDHPLQGDMELVGPEPISMRSLYSKLRRWLGLSRERFFRLPYRLALQGARWSGFMGQTPITREAVQMLRDGNTGEVEPIISRFGFTPRGMDALLAETPTQQADLWHARLYFLAPILRLAIAFVWLFSGFVSAFVYPLEQSYAMLEKVGIPDLWQPLLLYGAAGIDMLIGIAMLLSHRLRLLVPVQIGIIMIYTLIITLWLPEHWIHPFGPVSKNIPLTVSILILLVLEERR